MCNIVHLAVNSHPDCPTLTHVCHTVRMVWLTSCIRG